MAYETIHFELKTPAKAVWALMDRLKIARGEAQRLIDKRRVSLNGETLEEKGLVSGEIAVKVFSARPSGLKPIFTAPDFAVFDKPPFMLAHPNGFGSDSTLLDDARAIFGGAAQLCHRIDRETSGLMIVSLSKSAEAGIKDVFAARLAQKTYLAYARGRVSFEGIIDAPIAQGTKERNSKLGIPKVIGAVSRNGKSARTLIKPLKYLAERDATLVEAKPVTGRTHQIRIHLAHIGHPVLGDALYGASADVSRLWLDRALNGAERIALTGADRLLLHAHSIEFFYKSRFFIKSPVEFAEINLPNSIKQ